MPFCTAYFEFHQTSWISDHDCPQSPGSFGTRENLPGFAREKLPTLPNRDRRGSAVPNSNSGLLVSPKTSCRAANDEAKANLNPWRLLLADLPPRMPLHAFGVDDIAPCPAANRVLGVGNSNQTQVGNSSRAPKPGSPVHEKLDS